MDQAGILPWLSYFGYPLQGGRLNSNLSRMAVVVWLFVALLITQSYTASFTSMFTIHKLEPKVSNIETLKTNNVMIGHTRGFYAKYLEEVLAFKSKNLKSFSSQQEYAEALKSISFTKSISFSP
ncbi:hypothetical protein POM88_052912 [Heracleum sosnowskyi]|uniref:Ionotropic glutamate receptor C-terminal domain-containing protein n=1 Tax=Heracleum sosnowskyi TaxID=360622 RepID=A0AAD8LYP6_9APIA|nr:hypothetical protein POM88_052912 [Heracleum sosnowskyi]